MCGATVCLFYPALKTTGDRFRDAIERIDNAIEKTDDNDEATKEEFEKVAREEANKISEALLELLLLKGEGDQYNHQYIYAVGLQLAKISSDLVEIAFEKKSDSDARTVLKAKLSALLTGMFLHCSN